MKKNYHIQKLKLTYPCALQIHFSDFFFHPKHFFIVFWKLISTTTSITIQILRNDSWKYFFEFCFWHLAQGVTKIILLTHLIP